MQLPEWSKIEEKFWGIGSRLSGGTDPSGRGIQRGRQAVLAEIPVAGEYLRAQFKRRVQSQPARLAAEPSVQIGLASLTKELGDTVLDPTTSRARCYPSVQCVRTPLGLQSRPAVRQRPWSRFSRGTDSPRRRIQRGRQNRSCRGFCRRRLSSRTAQSGGSFPTSQACRGIFCANQFGFTCEEFQRQSA